MKKLSLWLVVLSMLMTLLPGAMVSAEDAWFDLEVENGTTIMNSQGIFNNDSASGGKYLIANNGCQGNHSTIEFSREAEGTYDVWAIIGVDASNYIGGYTFTLDGDDVFYSKSTELANADSVGDALYTSDQLTGGAHHKPMKWVKLAEGKTIAAGSHTLKAEVSKATATANKYGAMDVVRLVPSDWEWVPDSSLDAPVDPSAGGEVGGGEGDGGDEGSDVITDEWFDIEAENGTYEGTLLTRDSEDGERTYMYTIQGTTSARSTTNTFTTAEAGTYDIWAAVGVKAADYLCAYAFTLGDEELYNKNMNVVNGETVGDGMYETQNVAAGNTLSMKWVKIAAAKEIAAGTTTITSTIGTCAVGNDLGAIDVVRFVPSDWEWTPDSNFDAPVDQSAGGEGGNEGDDPVVNEWFDLEFEDGENAVTIATNNDTGRKFTVSQLYSDSNRGQPVTMNFSLEEEKTFDVWAIIGIENWDYLGGYTFALDGEAAFYDKLMNEAYNDDAVGDVLYMTGDLSSASHYTKMMWVKVADNKTIGSGDHSLVVTPKAAANGNCAAAMDVVRFVPSDWEWTPGSNFDAPEDMSSGGGADIPPVEGGYVHAEAEDASYTEGKYTLNENYAAASNGKALMPVDGIAPAETAIAFDVTIPEAQEYDVYALVALKDMSSSAWRLLVDGTSYDQQLFVGAGQIYGININLGYSRKMHWVKMAGNVALAAGDTTVVASLPTQTHSASWLTAIDAIRIVPSNWFWSPDASLDAPTKNLLTPDSDGVIQIEAENMALGGTFAKVDDENAIGGAYAIAKSTNVAGSAAAGFTLEEEGTYDIMAAVGVTAGYNYLGGYKFSIDSEEIYSKCMSQVEASGEALYDGIVMHTGSPVATAAVYWTTIATGKTLSAGDHVILAETREGLGAANRTGLIDSIKIVPSTGGGDDGGDGDGDGGETPVPPAPGDAVTSETGIFWMESNSAEFDSTLWKTVTNADASGGTLLDTGTETAGDVSEYTIGYAFETEEETVYDVWALVNNIAGHTSSYDYIVDDASVAASVYGGGTYSSSSTHFGGYRHSMTWQKVADARKLSAGAHTLVIAPKKSAAFANRMLAAVDCVVVVPTALKWKPDTEGANPEYVNASAGRLAAEYVKNSFFTGDYTAVTGNIELPESVPAVAGAAITYECDDASVIDANGVVTRPYFNAEDVTVNFNICATVAGVVSKTAIPMTVLKNTKYTVAELEISEAIVAGGTFTASADVNVNVASDSEITGKASLVAALYNANGALEDIAMAGDVITSDASTLSVSLTMPENVTGKTVKVFIINGFEMGNQLIDTIVVD